MFYMRIGHLSIIGKKQNELRREEMRERKQSSQHIVNLLFFFFKYHSSCLPPEDRTCSAKMLAEWLTHLYLSKRSIHNHLT